MVNPIPALILLVALTTAVVYKETYIPRLYTPGPEIFQTPGNISVWYLPMCGHERLAGSTVEFNIIYNSPDNSVNFTSSPINITVYLNYGLKNIFATNYVGYDTWVQQFSAPYPTAFRPEALYLVATTSANGLSATSAVTQWTFSVTFNLATTVFAAGVVNTEVIRTIPPPQLIYVDGGVPVPLQVAQQHISPVKGSVVTQLNFLQAMSYRYVISVCMMPETAVVENFVQVADRKSRVEFYVCAGNLTESIRPGLGCMKDQSIGGPRQSTATSWSRLIVPLNATTMSDELHGVIQGHGASDSTSNFLNYFRLGPVGTNILGTTVPV